MRATGEPDFPASERFTLLRRLGEGRAGAVFEAQDEETSAVVALKVLRPVDPAAAQRVEVLFRRMADVRHPNLVALHGYFRGPERAAFSMELVEGVDVLQYVWGGRRFDPIRLDAAMLGLAKGLTALHAAGTAHGELKPSDVRVTPQGRVILLESITAEAGAAAPAADWYSVGYLLHEALTGRPPIQKQGRPPAPPREIAPGVPEHLDELCQALLDPSPERRPSDAEVMAWLSGRRPRPRPPEPPARAPRAPPAPPTAPRAFAGGPGQPPFVGRGAELEALRELLGRLGSGPPATALISGESGIGKTALLGRFLLDAEKQGALCFSGRCYARLAIPYNALAGPVAQLSAYLRRRGSPFVEQVLPREAGALARAFPELLQVPQLAAPVDGSPPPADPAEARQVAFAALAELLARLAQQQPVVLAVDDLHAADEDSLDLLAAVLRPRGAPTPLLLIGARRPPRGEPFQPQLDLPLGPLGPEESLDLVRRMPLLPGMGPPTTPEGVARIGRGVPLLLVELLRQPAGVPAPASPVRVEETVDARIAGLDANARRLLELVALAGDPIPPAAAARAAAEAPDSIESPEGYGPVLARLREMGLVESTDQHVDVAHEKVREVASARVKEADLPQHHRLLARALSAERERGARAGLIGHHLGRAGSGDLAAEALREAADGAARRYAFKLASALYRQGLKLTRQAQPRRLLHLGLAASLSGTGHPAEAAEALVFAAEGAAPPERARLRLAAAEHLLAGGQVAAALTLYEELAPQAAGLLRARPATARRALALERVALRVAGHRRRERPPAQTPAEAVLVVEAARTVAASVWPMDATVGAALATRALRMALKLGDGPQAALALMQEAVLAGQAGNRRRVRALAEEAVRAAGPAAGEPRVGGFLAGLEGIAAYHLGAFGQAAEKLAETERHRDLLALSTWHLGTFRLYRLWALRDAGRYAELVERLERWLEDASGRKDAFSRAALLRGGVSAWMVRDDPQGALRGLEETRWPSPWGGQGALDWPELWARGNLALYAREGGALRARFKQPVQAAPRWHLARNQIARCRTWFLRGRFALMDASMSAEVRAAVAEAAQMARALEGESTAYAATWALLLRAGVAYQKMDFERSALRLREAVSRAEAAGLRQYALAGRRRLGELLGGEEGAALVRQANETLSQLGVRNPKRLCDALAPGLRT